MIGFFRQDANWMIYLSFVVRGQLDPVFSVKNKHKSVHTEMQFQYRTLLFNSHENYNTTYDTCRCTSKLHKK